MFPNLPAMPTGVQSTNPVFSGRCFSLNADKCTLCCGRGMFGDEHVTVDLQSQFVLSGATLWHSSRCRALNRELGLVRAESQPHGTSDIVAGHCSPPCVQAPANLSGILPRKLAPAHYRLAVSPVFMRHITPTSHAVLCTGMGRGQETV